MAKYYEAPKIAQYLADALLKDYFVPFIITSQTQGRNQSTNLPFGLGKTSLAWWISYVMHGSDEKAVEETKTDFFYYPSKLFKAAMPSNPPKPKIPCAIWDDVQATAPKANSVPAILQRMAGYITTNRPEISTLCLTTNNINAIAAPVRGLPVFELIVYERGKYEVQQIKFRKNFKNPQEDYAKLDYRGQGIYDPMPPEIQSWYDEWRRQQKIPQAKKLIMDLENYERKELPPEVLTDEEASDWGRKMANIRYHKSVKQFEEAPVPESS